MLVQTVMNTTRTVFGRHRQGHIIPLLLNVKPMETSFAGVLQALDTTDQFMLFFSNAFTVSGGTMDSQAMMGVKAHPIPINTHVQLMSSTRFIAVFGFPS